MSDRQRRFDRIPIESLKGRLHTPRDLTVRDLSRTGMSFGTDEALEEGKDYFVELSHRGQSVKLAVNVRWVRREDAREGEPPRYHVGVEFVDVLERPPTGIWDWVRVVGQDDRPDDRPGDDYGWPP